MKLKDTHSLEEKLDSIYSYTVHGILQVRILEWADLDSILKSRDRILEWADLDSILKAGQNIRVGRPRQHIKKQGHDCQQRSLQSKLWLFQ